MQGIMPALDALIAPILQGRQSLLTCTLILLVADLVDAHIPYLEVGPCTWVASIPSGMGCG